MHEGVRVVSRDGKDVLVAEFLRPCPEDQKKAIVLDMDMDRAVRTRDEVAFGDRRAGKVASKESSDTRGNEEAANDHDEHSL